MESILNLNLLAFAGLTFAAVMCIGGAVLAVGAAQREQMETRLHGKPPELPSARGRKKRKDGGAFARIGKIASPKGVSSNLQKQMTRAGFHSPAAATIFIGTKIFLFALAFVAAMVGASLIDGPSILKITGVVSVAGLTFFLPNMWLEMKINNRSSLIRQHLPDAIDLLEICVSGGMGIDQAWNAVEKQIRPVCGPLADEIALTNLEIHLGADRGDALRHMAERTGAEDLNSLVAVLVQSRRFGTSLSEALRVFTTSMREQRSARAEEMAEKMSVKMIFPMVVFIFPVILIFAVGPAGITLTEMLGGN